MSFRITESADGQGTNLKVDGRLAGDAVAELARVSENAAKPLTLDLSGVQFADADGVDVLEEIRAGGARLHNVPPYVSLLLAIKQRRAAAGREPSAQPAPGGLRSKTGEIWRVR